MGAGTPITADISVASIGLVVPTEAPLAQIVLFNKLDFARKIAVLEHLTPMDGVRLCL